MSGYRKKSRDKKRLFSPDSGNIYDCIEKFFDVAALSIIWLIASLPLVTIGASTAALYYTVNKVIRQERGYLLQEFIHSFKLNFKEGTVLWLILGGISFLLQLNIGILYSLTDGLLGLFFIIFYIFLNIWAAGVGIYAFPILSRFDMNFGWILKLAIYMTVRYLPATLLLLIILAVSLGLVYYLPLLLILIPSGVIYGISFIMEPILQKHKTAEESIN